MISRRTGELELDESAIIWSYVRELEYSPEAGLAPTHVGVPELLGVDGVVPVEAAVVMSPLWSGGLELAPSLIRRSRVGSHGRGGHGHLV